MPTNNRKETFRKYPWQYAPLLIICLADLLWKIPHLGDYDIGFDEPFSVFHAQESIGEILALSFKGEPAPPLFTLLLHFWIKLSGISPLTLRILPLLFNLVTIIYLYRLSYLLFRSVPAAVVSVLLFTFTCAQFYYAFEIRAYGLMSACTAASLYYYVLLVKEPERKTNRWKLALAYLCLVYTHYFGFFVLFTHFLFSIPVYLKQTQRRLFLKAYLYTLLTVVIVYAPYLFAIIRQFFISSKGTWAMAPSKEDFMNVIILLFNGPETFHTLLWILLYTILASGLLLLLHLKKFDRPTFIGGCFLLLSFLLPYTIMFFLSFRIPMFADRYVLYTFIPLYVFIGSAGAVMFRNGFMNVVYAGVLLYLFIPTFTYPVDTFYKREPSRAIAAVEHLINDSTVIFIHPPWADLGLMYYHDRETFSDPEHYAEALKRKHIVPILSFLDIDEKLKKDGKRFKNIIFYQSSSDWIESDFKINRHLDSFYVKTDSVYYENNIRITNYEK